MLAFTPDGKMIEVFRCNGVIHTKIVGVDVDGLFMGLALIHGCVELENALKISQERGK